jgi:hypothetical protein
MTKASLFTLVFGAVCMSLGATTCLADDTVDIYPAITAADTVVIEGRVIERKKDDPPGSADGKRRNMRRALDRMINDERRHYPVVVRFAEREWRVTTDSEGYFRAEVDGLNELAAGWTRNL